MILKEIEDLKVITLPDGEKAYLKEEVDEMYNGLYEELYAAYSELDNTALSRKNLYKQIDNLTRKVEYWTDMYERLKEEYARLQRRVVH